MLNAFAKLIEQGLDLAKIGSMAAYKAEQLTFLGGADAAAHRALQVRQRQPHCARKASSGGFGGLDGAHVNEESDVLPAPDNRPSGPE
jgi:hypothetical protein